MRGTSPWMGVIHTDQITLNLFTADFSFSVLSVQKAGSSGTDSSCNNLHLFISIVKIDLIPLPFHCEATTPNATSHPHLFSASTTATMASVLKSAGMSTKGVTVVLGAQWGDEGKGKLSDILSQEADVCARCQVGRICHGTGMICYRRLGKPCLFFFFFGP